MWAAKYVSSAVVGETIPEAVKGKTFYDLQAPLPGSKGTFDFVSTSTLVDRHRSAWNNRRFLVLMSCFDFKY